MWVLRCVMLFVFRFCCASGGWGYDGWGRGGGVGGRNGASPSLFCPPSNLTSLVVSPLQPHQSCCVPPQT